MNDYDRMAAKDDLDPIDVTLYTIDAEGLAHMWARGRMDVVRGLTRAEAVEVLADSVEQMLTHPVKVEAPGKLLASAEFPGHGMLAVVGGVEVDVTEVIQ